MKKTQGTAYLLIISVLFSQISFLSARAQEEPVSAVACVFTRPLTVGVRGEDVLCLQKYLSLTEHFVFAGGPTGYFGIITRQAVAAWQADNGVFPAAGYFGVFSRGKYLALSEKPVENVVKTNGLFPPTVGAQIIPTPQVSQYLALPTIPDSEIVIDGNGIYIIEDYLSYLANNYGEISFDGKKFDLVLKGENKVPLFVPELIEKAMSEGDFSKIQSSLVVYKEFLEAKLEYLQSIKVIGEIIEMHKKMIAFDKLTLVLIQMALNVPFGIATKEEVSVFYKKYESLANAEHAVIRKKVNQLFSIIGEEKKSLFVKILEKLGLENNIYAHAVNTAFGGPIGVAIPCLCSAGSLLPVGPPRPAMIFISFFFFASPLLFKFKSLRSGAFWLGLYAPVPVPCIVYVPPAECVNIASAPPVMMAGTSL